MMGTFLRSPYNKDYNIMVSILGSAYFGKLPLGLFRNLALSRRAAVQQLSQQFGFSLRLQLLRRRLHLCSTFHLGAPPEKQFAGWVF